MNETYELEKWIWTEDDFEQMGWHDCQILAIAFWPGSLELIMDIDYIAKWVHPQAGEVSFKLWIAPATLVFENMHDLEIELGSDNGGLEIDRITRAEPSRPHNADHIGKETHWKWTIDCQEGEIRFQSAGYKQFIRRAPHLLTSQTLDEETRGISFHRGRTD